MKHVVNKYFYVPIYCVSMTMPVILIVTITIIIIIIIIIVSLRSACNLTFYFVLAMNQSCYQGLGAGLGVSLVFYEHVPWLLS